MEETEERVYGLIYEQSDSEDTGAHTHEMLLMTWDGRVLHTHGFSGITSQDIGHRHSYSGITDPAPNGVQHTHSYSTTTSFNDGHVHHLRGTTGPAIPIHSGLHIHYFEGVTTVNGRTPHSHSYSGRTGNEQAD